MRALMILCGVLIVAVLATASISRGDNEGESDGTTTEPADTTEPITGTAVMPNPGSDEQWHDPFTPYDIGGAASAWKYEDLTGLEKATADRGLDEDQTAVQDAYAAASRDLAKRAAAEAAAAQLGIENPQMGVVP